MTTTFDPNSIPNELSDAQARKILEEVAPRARKISEDVVRNNAVAEQGQQRLEALKKKAEEAFGTSDPVKLAAIRDERMAANAEKVRTYLENLQATEAKIDALKKVAPGR